MAKHILLLNGPNLNLLGLREPHIYGTTTLPQLISSLQSYCASHNPPIHLSTYQSNHEGALLDMIQSTHPSAYTFTSTSTSISTSHLQAQPAPSATTSSTSLPATKETNVTRDLPNIDAIVINPGGLTHTSVVLRDALAGVGLPFVEVHITNVHTREEFRQKSFLSAKAAAVVCGMGVFGYEAAVGFLARGWK